MAPNSVRLVELDWKFDRKCRPSGRHRDQLNGAETFTESSVLPERDSELDPGLDSELDPGLDSELDPGLDSELDPGLDSELDPDFSPRARFPWFMTLCASCTSRQQARICELRG